MTTFPGRAAAGLPILMTALSWQRPFMCSSRSSDVPAFVKFEGPLSMNGPAWRIELTSPRWQE